MDVWTVRGWLRLSEHSAEFDGLSFLRAIRDRRLQGYLLQVRKGYVCRSVTGLNQQPGGDTPGVAARPLALAGAIVLGAATFMVNVLLGACRRVRRWHNHRCRIDAGAAKLRDVLLNCTGRGAARNFRRRSGKAAPLVGTEYIVVALRVTPKTATRC